MCTVLLPPGGYPIEVNKYIIYPIHISDKYYRETKKHSLYSMIFFENLAFSEIKLEICI
jgi:hypothetical protein